MLDLLYSQSELTSPFLESINYTQQVLNKMLKIDWKYHVFHQFFKFHEIYRVHSGLCGQFDDPAHVLRKKKFNKYFHQVENWVKESTIFNHIHEIELDIHDIKIYLQEFYASIQRKKRICHTESSAVEAIQRYEMQLLEYRYIFGQFFANLIENGEDGRQLRLQFLFVDRYFENAASIIEK